MFRFNFLFAGTYMVLSQALCIAQLQQQWEMAYTTGRVDFCRQILEQAESTGAANQAPVFWIEACFKMQRWYPDSEPVQDLATTLIRNHFTVLSPADQTNFFIQALQHNRPDIAYVMLRNLVIEEQSWYATATILALGYTPLNALVDGKVRGNESLIGKNFAIPDGLRGHYDSAKAFSQLCGLAERQLARRLHDSISGGHADELFGLVDLLLELQRTAPLADKDSLKQLAFTNLKQAGDKLLRHAFNVLASTFKDHKQVNEYLWKCARAYNSSNLEFQMACRLVQAKHTNLDVIVRWFGFLLAIPDPWIQLYAETGLRQTIAAAGVCPMLAYSIRSILDDPYLLNNLLSPDMCEKDARLAILKIQTLIRGGATSYVANRIKQNGSAFALPKEALRTIANSVSVDTTAEKQLHEYITEFPLSFDDYQIRETTFNLSEYALSMGEGILGDISRSRAQWFKTRQFDWTQIDRHPEALALIGLKTYLQFWSHVTSGQHGDAMTIIADIITSTPTDGALIELAACHSLIFTDPTQTVPIPANIIGQAVEFSDRTVAAILHRRLPGNHVLTGFSPAIRPAAYYAPIRALADVHPESELIDAACVQQNKGIFPFLMVRLQSLAAQARYEALFHEGNKAIDAYPHRVEIYDLLAKEKYKTRSWDSDFRRYVMELIKAGAESSVWLTRYYEGLFASGQFATTRDQLAEALSNRNVRLSKQQWDTLMTIYLCAAAFAGDIQTTGRYGGTDSSVAHKAGIGDMATGVYLLTLGLKDDTAATIREKVFLLRPPLSPWIAMGAAQCHMALGNHLSAMAFIEHARKHDDGNTFLLSDLCRLVKLNILEAQGGRRLHEFAVEEAPLVSVTFIENKFQACLQNEGKK